MLLAVCLAAANAAAGKRQIQGWKTTEPPTIDGDLSDPGWAKAGRADGFTDIQNGSPVTDQTIALLMYDDKYIYIGFECSDSKPESIVARETVRDAKFNQSSHGQTNNEDNIEVQFDPFTTFQGNDISAFSVNAIGTRSAALAGGRASKAEWKGDWDASVKRTASGWTCEMRIPWASLNYPSGKKAITMGINFLRFQDRTKILSMWSNTTSQGFNNLEGLWTDVSVPHDGFRRKLSVLPYFLGGVTGRNLSGKVGLDARYSLTPQLTAVGSVEPDFSTVEGAIQSIAFSHSERFVPDRRPFFTEGGNDFYAQTNINDIGAFFYSNRIDTFDVGTKLYGKLTPKDTIGFLDTVRFDDGRNDLVSRYVHSFSDTSSGGLMLVSTNAGGVQNTNAIADNHMRWGKLAFESIGATSIGQGAGGGAQVVSSYYADKFLTSMLQYSGVSNNFLVPDGFIPFTGYKGLTEVEDWSAQWQHGFWRGTELTLVGLDWLKTGGGHYFSGVQASYSLDTRTDWHVEFDAVNMDFEGSKDRTLGFNVVKGATNRFCQFGLQGSTGLQGSRKSTFLGPTVSLRILKKLDVLYNGAFQNRVGLDQQHVVTLNYEVSPLCSFGGRIVAQNSDTNAYFFYHRSGGKGTDLFFILGDPNAPRTVRSAQLKLVFAFQS